MTQPASNVDSQTAEHVTQQATQTPAPQSTQQSTQPQTQQSQPSSQIHQSADNGPIDRLMSALEALPERVAAAVREQSPQHPQRTQRQSSQQSNAQSNTGQQSSGNQATQQAASTEQQRPGKRSFADWWFNG